MPSKLGAWTVASMAYTKSNVFGSKSICYTVCKPTYLARKECRYFYHEVAFDIFHLWCKPCLLGVHHSPLNLVVIVVKAHDVAVCKTTDLASRSPNTTAYIKNGRTLSDTDFCSEIMLMPIAS